MPKFIPCRQVNPAIPGTAWAALRPAGGIIGMTGPADEVPVVVIRRRHAGAAELPQAFPRGGEDDVMARRRGAKLARVMAIPGASGDGARGRGGWGAARPAG